ncbi:Sphingosine kinase 1 [Acipenser ruthenus]|uniref:sphingosine kinase n=1 Tax=Acipenser ruthenus TaxID=7906 RepID=A0A444U095_ACIRT|nr:Sphingosine kinase 1 [Acipenser ruthenus]
MALPLSNGTAQVLLCGEFTLSTSTKDRYSVRLTSTELQVQKTGQTRLLLQLLDCIGCRAFKGEDSSDAGAYFSAYFYPFKKRWMSSGAVRQRVVQTFRVEVSQDPLENLKEAEKWAQAIRDSSIQQLPKQEVAIPDWDQYTTLPCLKEEELQQDGDVYPSVLRIPQINQSLRRASTESITLRAWPLLVLVNPHSGTGHAPQLFHSHVQDMLTEAGAQYTLLVTERQNHAHELLREADLSQWDALVILSGDGLLFEVVNGLMERADWEDAVRKPLGILPGGSGNAVAASVNHYSGSQALSSEELLLSCTFLLCKGLVSPLDLASVTTASGQRHFSFLSVAWGFVSDVDIESEKYRRVGAARFTVGTLMRLASLRVYRGRLAYLPAQELPAPGLAEGCPDLPGRASLRCLPSESHSAPHTLYNSSNSNNSGKAPSPGVQGPADTLLAPLDQPVPAHWTVVKEERFVLVLAVYQSHLSQDLLAAPKATLGDGLLHLFYVRAGISRAALLRLFLAMEKGTHLELRCPHLSYMPVRAFRLEPCTPKGVITVDGEAVEYGPIQAQVHRGLGRLITG